MHVNLAPLGVVYLAMHRDLSPDFERFVLERSTGLLRTAVLLVGDRGHAEDLVQTALLRLARRWGSIREHPEAYARMVLVNLTRDHWRRLGRHAKEQELDEAVQHAVTRDPADTVVDRDALRRALAGLPRRQREVMVLRFFVDLSVAETAAALGVSEGTVKTQTSRAVTRLRQELGEKVGAHEH
jgi:RNA polymerase sigma-70 factor (sigma-E family)